MTKPLICFILLLGCLTAAPTGPCKVAFRLDDIQEDWLAASQKAVIEAFTSNDIPLTVGIISNYFGASFSPQTNGAMAKWLDGKLAAGAKIEAASHTTDHESLQSQTYEKQVEICTNTKSQIASNLPSNKRPVQTMVCPLDQFNNATLYALRATGFTTLSAMMDPNTCNGCDNPPHNFYLGCDDTGNVNGVVHVPSKAQTSTNANGIRIPPEQILATMENSINLCGWSVVEMHFTEFTDSITKQPKDIDSFDVLFKTIKEWGCTFHYLSDLLSSPSTPTTPNPIPPPPQPTPTPSPSQLPIPPPPQPTPTPSPSPSHPPVSSPTPQPNPTPSPSPSPSPDPAPISKVVPSPSNQTRTSGSSSSLKNPMIAFAFGSLIIQLLF